MSDMHSRPIHEAVPSRVRAEIQQQCSQQNPYDPQFKKFQVFLHTQKVAEDAKFQPPLVLFRCERCRYVSEFC